MPTDSVAQRIERVIDAWAFFVRRFQAWQRDKNLRSIEWLRVLEWTPGEHDHKGHPHLHLWIFSPFLEAYTIRESWADALRKAGYVDCVVPIIKIKEVYEGPSLSLELIKYLTKDIDEHGDKIGPELYAEVYTALDGRRVLQSSQGFMGLGDRGLRACEGCGASLPRVVKRKPRATDLPKSGGRGREMKQSPISLSRWLTVRDAASLLSMTPDALRRSLERRARRTFDGGVEANIDGVRARKFGRLWRVLLAGSWASTTPS